MGANQASALVLTSAISHLEQLRLSFLPNRVTTFPVSDWVAFQVCLLKATFSSFTPLSQPTNFAPATERQSRCKLLFCPSDHCLDHVILCHYSEEHVCLPESPQRFRCEAVDVTINPLKRRSYLRRTPG